MSEQQRPDIEPIYVSTEVALSIVQSMYLGERCKYCGKEYKTLEDLEATVFAGYHEHGRLACQSCWDDHHQSPAPLWDEHDAKKALILQCGTQIIYVPDHAEGDIEHPDCEQGFVTSARGAVAFCRYWSNTHGGLRTVANSEATPIRNLVVKDTHPQAVIDQWLEGQP